MYEKILAALDGSERAPSVASAALAVAECCGGRVHLFRAMPVPPEFPAAAVERPDDVPALLEAEARAYLEGFARASPRFTVEPPDLVTPQPWRAILAAAARIDADLIVVGSHGYGGWDHVLGTVAAKVADRADRHVLVVHARAPPGGRGAGA